MKKSIQVIKAIVDGISIGIADLEIKEDGMVSYTYGIIAGEVEDKAAFDEAVNSLVIKLIEEYNNDRETDI